jgi:hypothetical protein
LWLLLSVPADYYNKGTKLMKRLLGIINKNDAQITITKGKRLSSSLNARQQAENRSIPGTLRLLLPSGHGCYTGFLDCLRSFRVKHWRDLFQSHGFRVLRIEPLLLYGASEWPIIPTNRFLTRFGLRSSVLFIMEQIDRPTGFNSRFKDFRNGTARQSNTVSRSESTPGKEVRTCQR